MLWRHTVAAWVPEASSTFAVPFEGACDFGHLLYSLSKSLFFEGAVGDWAERRASFSSALLRKVRLLLSVSL
jgi:hypothetical protein